MAENLLTRLFAKMGIKNVQDLKPEERTTFDNYERILSKKDLTIEDMRHFLQTQVSIIEGKWRDYNLSAQAKSEFVPYHTCYKVLLTALDAPAMERAQLENHLLSIINQ